MSDIAQFKTSLTETKSDLSDQLVSLSKAMTSVNAVAVATQFFSSDEWSNIKSQLSKSDYHSFANNFLSSIPNLPNYAIYDNGESLYDETNLLSKIPSNVKDLLEKVDQNKGKDIYSLGGYRIQAIGSTVIYSEQKQQYAKNSSAVISIVGPSINGTIYNYNIQVVYNYVKVKKEQPVEFKTETQTPITLAFDTSAETLTLTTFPFVEKTSIGNTTLNQYTLPSETYNASVALPLTGTIVTDLGSISFTPNSDGTSSVMTITIPVSILINANVTKVYNYNGLIVEN